MVGRIVFLGYPIFRGYVSFTECIIPSLPVIPLEVNGVWMVCFWGPVIHPHQVFGSLGYRTGGILRKKKRLIVRMVFLIPIDKLQGLIIYSIKALGFSGFVRYTV